MSQAFSKTICLACSVFRSELEALRASGDIDLPVRYLNSKLHMDPAKLHRHLDTLLKRELEQGHKVLLLYGDCHPYMHQQETVPGVRRVSGLNCLAILLGWNEYRSLRRAGVFFLLPEWTIRWREFFQNELGLEGEVARAFMQEMHTGLVYLDTGQIPIPTQELEAFSAYTGLPWEIRPVSPDHLLSVI